MSFVEKSIILHVCPFLGGSIGVLRRSEIGGVALALWEQLRLLYMV